MRRRASTTLLLFTRSILPLPLFKAAYVGERASQFGQTSRKLSSSLLRQLPSMCSATTRNILYQKITIKESPALISKGKNPFICANTQKGCLYYQLPPPPPPPPPPEEPPPPLPEDDEEEAKALKLEIV